MVLRIKNKTKNVCSLDKLALNERAKIININSKNPLVCRRLYDMGVTSGVVVQIKKKAPLGDPISILVRGYELVLRRAELKTIEVSFLS